MASSPQKTSPDLQYCVIEAPFGRLGIETEMVEGSLMVSRIDYLPVKAVLIKPRNQLAREVAKQCQAYFKNSDYLFDLPLKPQGTDHQNKVWNSVLNIPAGQTSTYGQVAKQIKSGARAVGTACGANPYPLITPCHRVVSVQGLGGFMKEDAPGFYRQIKIWLLKHEGVI
ncbi:methylated-DNA--[protein]-cysteine S-methyltransferase [Polynucleobacter sp. AP-Latsch-80-C2]|jgi:methylated-DNA-[protein]-cysteine S-methyltransferase|uniref:methylated-DNA--[protein]-cysteine S-methyltransferase n=1 Tax=Polynucleobacter sp. AP-Latsch-80-C2 TaxID=2576931 RepID=UPI001C0AD7B3|nr:methylated-DNA--[protein]-cysteine S-methyltransferase [Polynucleobacter sp. AP-Latsch-80-C2]MBU3623334.1 methylated-DNA--[protein]-cysteine S-methyltransferase [Polynucleobacter sp. AP-Latsch-80-C2]